MKKAVTKPPLVLMEEEKKWPEDLVWWNKISEKSADLALSQSEAYLLETTKTSQTIQDRTDKLIAILVPITSAILIYLLTGTHGIFDVVTLSALIFVIIITRAIVILIRNLRPYLINVNGEDADVFLNNETINETDSKEEQYIKLALLACNNNKIRASQNDETNQKRSQRNKEAVDTLIIAMIFSPLIGVLIHLLYQRYS